MRFSKAIIPQSNLIPRPPCPNCGKQMWLALIVPHRLDHDKRTFECAQCEHEETVIVKYK